ncbi:MAG: M16 family metallopeptidase [Sporichthyaceae bacterium]
MAQAQPTSVERRRSFLPLLLALGILAAVLSVVVLRSKDDTASGAEVEIPTEKYSLANGMEVILAKVPGVPTVSTNVWYHVGAANEAKGRTGFAHLFEHMMFQGSGHIPEGRLEKLIESTGGFFNGTTNFDRTNYLLGDLPADRLELALWAESDRMGFLLDTLDAKSMYIQQQVVRNERRQSREQRPYGLSDDEIYAQLFGPDHPYAPSVIGSHTDIAAATLTDVEAFFKQYYVPANATLVIAGNFDAAQAKGWVEKYFGTLAKAPKPAKPQIETKPITAEKRVTLTDKVELQRIAMAWQSPTVFAPGDADADVAATVLGGGESSLLYRELVRDRKIAQNVYAYQQSAGVSSIFGIVATAKPGRTAEELGAAVDEILRGLGERGPSLDEVRAAQTTLVSDLVRGLESTGDTSGLADTLNRYNHYTGSPDYLGKDIERYQRVDADSVKKFIGDRLKPNERVVVITVPGERKLPPDPPAPPAPADTPTVVSAEEWRNKVPDPTPVPAPALPEIATFTLDNGMPVYLTKDSRLPVVTASLVSRYGSAADPADRPGLTQFTTTMLRQGAADFDAGAIAARIAGLGATLLSETRTESAALTLQTLTGQSPDAVKVLADLARRATFPEDAVARVRDDLKVARTQADNEPQTVANRLMRSRLYGVTHPYGHLSDGTREALDKVDRTQLVDYAAKAWNPQTTALVLAGDLTEAQARGIAKDAFGDWQGTGTVPAPPSAGTQAKDRLSLIDMPGRGQSAVEIGQVALARTAPDYEAVELGNRVLGGLGLSSRLNVNLREDKGWTYGAYSSFTATRGPGWFRSGASVDAKHTGDSIRELLAEIGRIRDTEVDAAELKAAKDSYVGSVPGLFQTTRDSARTVGLMFSLNLPLDYYRGLADRVGALTAAQVKDALNRQLKPEAFAIAVAGDAAAIRTQLDALKLGPVAVAKLGG